MTQLPVVAIIFNDTYRYYFDDSLLDSLRDSEMIDYYLNTDDISTQIIYDQKSQSVITAEYSIYTTSFVVGLLLGGIYAFSSDVQALVIQPIEKLVALVKKIAANPLGVEYKMLGADDGFIEGMETTVLLTTINKIGGLMRVGFGEAGAAIIAKNLQESTNGKLNLLGTGTLIYSIFGFCDVRQFTDTTECLQEEVMLFVNRIAHILHSIVVQCSGAANKNIGDAFLLTWKIDEKATKEQKALLADQALLTFCKALIELARHQEFICNFSVAATGRLFKRFPDYKVRIGSGLHVGWAIEGAIGSNRKIDASYISPHVSTTEFLESSTKDYGVSLLMSEPFYRLLSPAASRFVRQVDRIRRSKEEGPMGLYTYDCDLSIDWNDPFRHRRMSTAPSTEGGTGGGIARSRWRRTSQILTTPGGLQAALGLSTIQEVKSQSSASRFGGGPASSSNSHSQSQMTSHAPSQASRNNSNGRLPFNFLGDGGARTRVGSVASSGDHKKRSIARASVYGGARRPSLMLQPINFSEIPLNEVDEENPEAAEIAAADKLKQAKMTPTITVAPYTQQVWVEDQDLIDLRHLITDAFRSSWAEGMDAFIIGDWAKAKEKFSETLRMCKKDGASKKMLKFIEEEGGVSPDGWSGYRDLSSEGGGH